MGGTSSNYRPQPPMQQPSNSFDLGGDLLGFGNSTPSNQPTSQNKNFM